MKTFFLILFSVSILTFGLENKNNISLALAYKDIRFEAGPTEIIDGPNSLIDSPFSTFNDGSSLKGYIANSTTNLYTGTSLETLIKTKTAVLTPGKNFDSCGTWLFSVVKIFSGVIGLYHAESGCINKQIKIQPSVKSIALAKSRNNGLTFVKENYPMNQVISGPLTKNVPYSEGDPHILIKGKYIYIYFLSTTDWRIHVARASVSKFQSPEHWKKYYLGKYHEPGLGGQSSPIAEHSELSTSWISYNSYLKTYMGFRGIWREHAKNPVGIGISLSLNGMKWIPLKGLLLFSSDEWNNRTSSSGELIAYPSMISVYGSSQSVNQVFWVYYMYINPGEDFNKRYLLRRKVLVRGIKNYSSPVSHSFIALSRYLSRSQETKETTTNTSHKYKHSRIIGLILTEKNSETIPIYECIDIKNENSYILSLDNQCSKNFKSRILGWVSKKKFKESIPLYQCHDQDQYKNFLSEYLNCENKIFTRKIGYIMKYTEFPGGHLEK